MPTTLGKPFMVLCRASPSTTPIFPARSNRFSSLNKFSVAIAAAQAPGNLSAYQQQFGKELVFAVTGFTPTPGTNPNVWGTDQYTLDSNFAAAAVHAGLAKVGETVTVRVRVVQSPPQFVSTFRNNVNSTAYGAYPAGAYEFVRR